MKKIIFSLLVVVGFAFANKVQAQQIGFYYYPEQNVYYNTQSHQYAYQHNGQWSYARTLPSNVRVTNRSHVTVYRKDEEVWRDNDTHRVKYKNWGRKTKVKKYYRH